MRGGVGMGVGSWFEDNVCRVVDYGRSTYFWSENWVGGIPLQFKFPCLFYLALDR